MRNSVASYFCVIILVYRSLGYFDVVSEATEASMRLAVHEIQESPSYEESGEVYTCMNLFVLFL